jgi:hypothetical protein
MKILTKNRWLTLCSILFTSMILAGNIVRGDDVDKSLNVFVSSPTLPPDLKRVLVLPLAYSQSAGDMSGGCQTLNPVLRAALVKTGEFEVVAADPETLRSCTGQLGWTGEEVLPPNFFDSLKNVYGCDAVLFCELTNFRLNAPLAIGWRLKLADAKTGKILWAADEIFDASNKNTAKEAEQFEKSQQPRHNFLYNTYSFLAWCVDTPTRSALDDQWNILHSPRYFGEYSAEKLVKTLPAR